MTGRNFPPGEATQNPGPGAHCPEKVLIMTKFDKTGKNVFTFVILHFFFTIFPPHLGDCHKRTSSKLHLWPASLTIHLSPIVNVECLFLIVEG